MGFDLKNFLNEESKKDIIAGILNTSKSSISRLDNIRNNIIPEFMEIYKAGAITTTTANELAGVSTEGQKALWQQYQDTGKIDTKTAKATKEAAQEPQETPKQTEDKETVVQQKNKQDEAQEEPEEETTVTVTRTHDATDRTSLIIAGKINPNKEYNDMNVNYFIDATTNSDLFDSKFWKNWQNPGIAKPNLIEEMAGVVTTFNSRTGEPCECYLSKGFTVSRKEAQQEGTISTEEFIDLLNALVFTKVIEIKTERVDVAFWGKQTAREIAQRAMYLTEDELAVIQNIALNLKEREKS